MKKVITWILVLVVLGGAVGGGLWWRARQMAAQDPSGQILRSAQVVRGDLEITVAASGSVVSNRRMELAFRSPGTVQAIHVQEGEWVTAGQVLAELDRAPFERALRQAELALDQASLSLEQISRPATEEELRLAELAVQQAAQAMQAARASQQLAETQSGLSVRDAIDIRDRAEKAYEETLERLEQLALPDYHAAPAEAAYQEAEGNIGVVQVKGEYQIQAARGQWLAAYNSQLRARRELERLKAGAAPEDLRQAELQLELAELRRDEAQAALDATVLRAPFAGVVAAVLSEEGALTPANAPILVLLDTSSYTIDLLVDEIDIGKVSEGQKATVVLDAYPGTQLDGSVQWVNIVPTSAAGVVAYTVRVRMMDHPDVSIRQGMTASVSIHTTRIEDVLLVPNWAVRTDQSTRETYLYCYCLRDDGRLERVIIETGERNDMFTVVRAGLEEGTTVVLIAEERSLLDIAGPFSGGN